MNPRAYCGLDPLDTRGEATGAYARTPGQVRGRARSGLISLVADLGHNGSVVFEYDNRREIRLDYRDA